MKDLQLSLKRKWFEMTKSGEKTEDYRELNLYWFKRFVFKSKDVIKYYGIKDDWGTETVCKNTFRVKSFSFNLFGNNIMTLGYPKSTDSDRILKLEHKGIEIRTGNPELGAEPNKLYFVIKHGNILPNDK